MISSQSYFVTDWPSSLQSLWQGEWNTHLDHSLVSVIVGNGFASVDLSQHLPETLLPIAIASLQAFVQDNFTGPALQSDVDIPNITIPFEAVQNYLLTDGVELNGNVSNAWLLAVAKLIFTHLLETIDGVPNAIVYKCWFLRYCVVHQSVLDEHAGTLFTAINNTSDEIITQLDSTKLDMETRAHITLEIASAQLHYRRVWLAEKSLQTAATYLNASVAIEGRLGMRTKFQQKALPQLLLRVESDVARTLDAAAVTHPTSTTNQIPNLLQHDDDTRLEKIKFIDPADNDVVNVSSVLQSLILAKLYVEHTQFGVHMEKK